MYEYYEWKEATLIYTLITFPKVHVPSLSANITSDPLPQAALYPHLYVSLQTCCINRTPATAAAGFCLLTHFFQFANGQDRCFKLILHPVRVIYITYHGWWVICHLPERFFFPLNLGVAFSVFISASCVSIFWKLQLLPDELQTVNYPKVWMRVWMWMRVSDLWWIADLSRVFILPCTQCMRYKNIYKLF